MPRPNRNAEVDFKGEKRSNATLASTADQQARSYKKSSGTGAVLCFLGHALMENRSEVARIRGPIRTQPSGLMRAARRPPHGTLDRQSKTVDLRVKQQPTCRISVQAGFQGKWQCAR